MSTHKKRMICDKKGNVLQIVDNREVESVRAHRLSRIRLRANRAIENSVPEYKQRNVAMGIITGAEKTAILAQINEVRDYCNDLESQIEAVEWDGEESTKEAACDSIEAVGWSFVSQL